MAPKPSENPGRSARFYRDNPKARAKKNAAQRRRNKHPLAIKYRTELKAERRKRRIYGKGGDDMSHTKSGKLVAEDPKTNRARNGHGKRGRLK
jgi:hypothetical protein